MLPKNRRIERKFFTRIIGSGQRKSSISFNLYLTRINQENNELPSRFAFSVSKKVAKLAVERNKLRRRGYSVIARNIGKAKSGFFYFFIYKKGYQRNFLQIEKEILELL